MSYRRAWLLVDDLNRSFREPVVATKPGGAQGGGAALTDFGRELIARYRSIEAQAAVATRPQLAELAGALRSRGAAKRLKPRSIRGGAGKR